VGGSLHSGALVRLPAARALAAGAVCFAAFAGAAPARAAYSAEIVGPALVVRGNAASEALALRVAAGDVNLLEVDVGADGVADGSFDRSLFTEISVLAGGGSDIVTIDSGNGVFTDTEATTLDGQGGNDTLLGGTASEVLIGGPGRDVVDGGPGDDVVRLGAGNDLFVWQAGDGSDVVEGDAGVDRLEFSGSAGSEIIDLAANGLRLAFFRDIGNVLLDVDGVEQVSFAAAGGVDSIVVNDLSATAVQEVQVALEGTPGTGIGDAQLDEVLVNGTAGSDAFDVGAEDGVVVVRGVGAEVRVAGAEPVNDRVAISGVGGDSVVVSGSKGDDVATLSPSGVAGFARATVAGFSAEVDVAGAAALILDGLAGADSFSCSGNLAGTGVPVQLLGGAGDDTLLGCNGQDTIFGGSGRDFVDGQQGDDVILLGGGADRVQWDPGDGSDTIDGEGGADVLAFNASNGAEIIDLTASGDHLRLFRNIGNILLDVDGVEQVDVQALGGADVVTVDDIAATGVKRVNIDLETPPGSGIGDAQPDAIVVNGTPRADKIKIGPDAAGAVVVSGLRTAVAIEHSEPALDSLTVNGLGAVDKITVHPATPTLILLTVNPD